MDKTLYEFGQEMARVMPKFMREVLKRQASVLTSGHITIPQMLILNLLKEKGCCNMTERAKALSITTSAATGHIDRMNKLKLLKRVPDEKDRRVIKIKMTEKGTRIIDDIQKLRFKMMMDMFSKLEPDERKRYLETVKKIYRILREEKP